MNGPIEAWQCIGCGRLEAPQPCIGVCQDRKVQLVGAAEHQRAVEALATLSRRVECLEGWLRGVVGTHPKPGAWEAAFRHLQARAQLLLQREAPVHAPDGPSTQ